MSKTLPATEARVRFGELMRRVAEDGEEVVVEKGGVPKVVVVPIETWERLQGSGEAVGPAAALQRLAQLADRVGRRAGGGGLDAAEWIRQGRLERDRDWDEGQG